MSNDMPDDPLWREIERYYRRETLLLQDRRYREWLETMDSSITYKVPVTTSTEDGFTTSEDGLGYYDEDLALLKARVAKLESRQSWVERPPSRLRYFVQLIDVERQDGLLIARTNLLLMQHRWNMDQQFSGGRTDTLVVSDAGLRLKKRVVILDRQQVARQGLSVFF